MALAPRLLLTQTLPAAPSLQNNNLSCEDGVMTYVHASEVVVVEAGGSFKSLSSPLEEGAEPCQSRCITVQGETMVAVASGAGIKLCDKTGRRVLFSVTMQQLSRMAGGEIAYIQGITSLAGNEVAFGTSGGQILVVEFPLASTDQPVLKRIIAVGAVPITCLASDQDHFVCGCADGSIHGFEIETFAPCLRVAPNSISSPCTSLAIRSRVVVAAFTTGHLRFYRLFVDETTVEVAAHVRNITQVTLHPTKPLVATCGEDQHLSVWTFPDFKAQATSQVDLLFCEHMPNALLTGITLHEDNAQTTVVVVAYDLSTAYQWIVEAE